MEAENAQAEVGQHHKVDLGECCRICGYIKRRKDRLHPADAFKYEIEIIYGINISTDDEAIHPTKICNSCRMKFFHFRTQKSKRDAFQINIPKLFNFKAHSSDCKICNRQAGRPLSEQPFTLFEYKCQDRCLDGEADSMQSSNISATMMTDTADDFTFPQPGPSSNFLLNAPTNSDSNTKLLDIEPEPDKKKFKPTSLFQVTKTLNFSEETDHVTPSVTDITSITIDRAVENSLADILQCAICQGIPMEPVITNCNHIYCRSCINSWLKSANACPVCRAFVDLECFDVLRGQLALLYDTLHITCIYDNCQSTLLIKDLKNHENHCKFGKYPVLFKPASVIKRGESINKIPIYDFKAKYVKQITRVRFHQFGSVDIEVFIRSTNNHEAIIRQNY